MLAHLKMILSLSGVWTLDKPLISFLSFSADLAKAHLPRKPLLFDSKGDLELLHTFANMLNFSFVAPTKDCLGGRTIRFSQFIKANI